MMAADGADVVAIKTIVEAGCMRIFEACAFQDITGQRIAKVVNTLTFIEERLSSLQKVWGDTIGDVPADAPVEAAKTGEAILLNGPALAGEGINQSDVDALMNNVAHASPPSDATVRVTDILNSGTADDAPVPSDLDAKIDALFR
jgi:chemotaxis protein CheZ